MNTNTTNNTAIPTNAADNAEEVATKAYIEGLLDCYREARDVMEVRMDMAQAMAQAASEEFYDFLGHIMMNASAYEFERFIESDDLSSSDRIACIALFAKHHLPDDYSGGAIDGSECCCGTIDESKCSCGKCSCDDTFDNSDVGEIGGFFDGQAELDKMVKANAEANMARHRCDDGMARLLADIFRGHAK